ncbi:MAG: MerR family transcriptional regulator [Spirochaetaceae bacterium]
MYKRKEVAEFLNINSETVRFYEDKGLLPLLERGSNGYRKYEKQHLVRLTFILQAKEFGFTLAEIKEVVESGIADYITRENNDKPNNMELESMLENKISSVNEQIDNLKIMKHKLTKYKNQKMYLDLKKYDFCKLNQVIDSVL